MRRTGDGVHQSPYATVAYPDMQRWHKDMQRWHKATDTPSHNYWVASFELPAVPSSTSRRNRRKHPPSARRGPVVTGSKPTLAITCYPPVPKRMHLRTTQECSFATVYQSHLCFCHRSPLRRSQDLCAGALGVSGCFSVALNATVAISRVSDCGYAIVAHKATTPSHNTGYFGVYRVGICRIFRGILSGITCTGR